jgi:hypothetical protein
MAPVAVVSAELRADSSDTGRAAVAPHARPLPGSDSGNERTAEPAARRGRSAGLGAEAEATTLPPLLSSLKQHQERILERAEELGFEDSADPLPENQRDLFLPESGPDFSRDRDPFSPTPAILQAVKRYGNATGFVPTQGPQSIPSINLRGYLYSSDATPGALLEVNGVGTYLVHVGDTISLQRQGGETVLKVREINKLNVLVEVGTLGHIIVVR